MLAINPFISKWQRLHHPSMDVSGDAGFYYQVYERLLRIVGREEAGLFPLLLYTENAVAVGLDGVYEYMYRSLGDVVVRWCERMGVNAHATSLVCRCVSEAVADAPRSSLRRWITDCVLSRDFLRLSGMLTYFAREDRVLHLIYPALRYRKAMFRQLAGNEQDARRLLWSDLAFNWQDKYGHSLPTTLARQCQGLASSGPDSVLLAETALNLSSIRSERLDAYTLVERKDNHALTLRHRDGRMFYDVTFPSPLPDSCQCQGLAVQLITYLDKTYANGPVCWLGSEVQADWNGNRIWNDIQEKEQAAAKRTCFITPFGKRISLYEDLCTVPQHLAEAQGIYPDEPTLFDFMECLKPGEAVDKAFCFR